MFFSLMKPYEAKVKVAKLDRASTHSKKRRAIKRIELIKKKIKAYQQKSKKTWIENVGYFDELTEYIARLVSECHGEFSGINGGKFSRDMEVKIYCFMKQKIDDAYRADQLDAELTLGEDVKYSSLRILPVLDELNAFIAGIEKEAKEYLEKLQELIDAFSYAD